MKRSSAILFWFIIIWFPGLAQKTSFFAEDLHFTIHDSLFTVDGLYYFRNNSGQALQQILFYPFPDVEEYGEIAFILVSVPDDTTQIRVKKLDKGALFQLELEAHEEKAYHIRYGQRTVSGKAKYIITTTQHWNQPFEFAKYSLIFSDTFVVDSTSLPPDSIATSNGHTSYFWSMSDFMPEADFYFEFHPKK